MTHTVGKTVPIYSVPVHASIVVDRVFLCGKNEKKNGIEDIFIIL